MNTAECRTLIQSLEAFEEGKKLLSVAVTMARLHKQNQCLTVCLKDARSALETPGDLNRRETRHLIEDINTLLKDVDARDNGEVTP